MALLHCRLQVRAHDDLVTSIDTMDHLLVSAGIDMTLNCWDMRNLSTSNSSTLTPATARIQVRVIVLSLLLLCISAGPSLRLLNPFLLFSAGRLPLCSQLDAPIFKVAALGCPYKGVVVTSTQLGLYTLDMNDPTVPQVYTADKEPSR